MSYIESVPLVPTEVIATNVATQQPHEETYEERRERDANAAFELYKLLIADGWEHLFEGVKQPLLTTPYRYGASYYFAKDVSDRLNVSISFSRIGYICVTCKYKWSSIGFNTTLINETHVTFSTTVVRECKVVTLDDIRNAIDRNKQLVAADFRYLADNIEGDC